MTSTPLLWVQLLMYDEPTAGLDPVASTVVEDLIRSLHYQDPSTLPGQPAAAAAAASSSNGNGNGNSASNGAGGNGNGVVREPPVLARSAGVPPEQGGISSYIVVTHQHSTIRRAVDRIIFLHEGRVVWEGTVQEFDTTDEPIVRQFASGSLDGPIVYL
jgi:hypothetical protein